VRWFLKEKGTKPGAERVDLIKELMNLKGKSGRLKGPNGKFWGAERPASTAGRVQPRPLEHRNGLLAIRASTRERHGTPQGKARVVATKQQFRKCKERLFFSIYIFLLSFYCSYLFSPPLFVSLLYTNLFCF
jgi:hypothetical protein